MRFCQKWWDVKASVFWGLNLLYADDTIISLLFQILSWGRFRLKYVSCRIFIIFCSNSISLFCSIVLRFSPQTGCLLIPTHHPALANHMTDTSQLIIWQTQLERMKANTLPLRLVKPANCIFWSASHSQHSIRSTGESAINPLPHTCTHRCPQLLLWLTGESQPESLANFAPLAPGHWWLVCPFSHG